jgi:glycosyltransferase involved in cell wall biosynthesis
MATIPWFPGASWLARWSSAGRHAKAARAETIDGMPVHHPRTLFLPRVMPATWGPLYFASILMRVRRYKGKVDVVLGSWAYPDGFAAVCAARILRVPCVVKVHGSDINVVARLPGPRRLIGWALRRAERVVVVSRALGDAVEELGVPRERISLVTNGVDATLFHPRSRSLARAELGLPDGPLALYVGNLKTQKGILDLAQAWERISDGHLVIVGDGPDVDALVHAVAPCRDRVRLVGAQPLARIPAWLAACDVLVLPSHAEGTPNVVLEALACGRRVVATRVGGIPDLLNDPRLGTMVPPRDPEALRIALADALRTHYEPNDVTQLNPATSWDESAAALLQVLRSAVAQRDST